jgi:hypothetical protein
VCGLMFCGELLKHGANEVLLIWWAARRDQVANTSALTAADWQIMLLLTPPPRCSNHCLASAGA